MVAPPLVSLRVVTLAPVPVPASRPMSYVVVLVHCTTIVDDWSTLAMSTPWLLPKLRFEALLIRHWATIVTSTVNVDVAVAAYAPPPTSVSPTAMHGMTLRILLPPPTLSAALTPPSQCALAGRYSGKVNC